MHMTSYEALTGSKPKIMQIYRFGCRMWAVKPRPAYSKTKMDGRAWVEINLGRCLDIPGAYFIWVLGADEL